uniref:Uncharacterized protein n=1 Tax=Eutreptiella gymnastica TaxID=73025 RepID=A0A7S4G9W7_9EUGL
MHFSGGGGGICTAHTVGVYISPEKPSPTTAKDAPGTVYGVRDGYEPQYPPPTAHHVSTHAPRQALPHRCCKDGWPPDAAIMMITHTLEYQRPSCKQCPEGDSWACLRQFMPAEPNCEPCGCRVTNDQ